MATITQVLHHVAFRTYICALLSLLCASPSAAETLRIYAASSMTNAVTSLVEEFKQQYEVDVTTVFGATSSLARQIEHGAPADIYIAANTKWVDHLIRQQVVNSDAVTNVASNKLVVASKQQGLKLDITQLQDWLTILSDGQRLAIAEPNAVPAGIYARQSLQSLDVWNSVNSKLAPTNNVRVALTLIEREEVPIGIVYQTDVHQSPELVVVAELPDESHQPIVYPMIRLTDHSTSVLFADFVTGVHGQAILSQYGFLPAKEPR
ncbi:molybdate ABC transporter substrate-binding protein [Vibrio sinaloensis]|uniref:molybdate ABC transporter substrate-binding protein n=1 Tax=Photobacterium sp. (strain ATCC 43367) TaxID=379097 RepID=UPI0020662730|nr:molybdate ABC transporter substrate-binding protein [Vibrio sinaloensis]UPQ89920.1 molybdate ABC transporter substrate-binding protein [Vibrio sinaloensis]